MNASCNSTLNATTADGLAEVNGNSSSDDADSVSNFPGDFLTVDQRLDGGLLLHFLLTLYACFALVGVCETYFVPSLHSISRRVRLSSDVVAALIMAGGGAIPGLFTSFIGTFVTEDDLGLGTIMGSACFNTFMMVGVCSMFAKAAAVLEWWPTTRDFFFFVVTISIMIVVIEDTVIHWYEAAIMLLTFAVYIIILVRNQPIREYCESNGRRVLQRVNFRRNRQTQLISLKVQFNKECIKDGNGNTKKSTSSPIAILQNNTITSYGGCKINDKVDDNSQQMEQVTKNGFNTSLEHIQEINSIIPNSAEISLDLGNHVQRESESTHNQKSTNETTEGVHQLQYSPMWPWERPTNHSAVHTAWWVVNIPIFMIFAMTIPDCRRTKIEKYFMVTFILSIAYLGVITYVLSWLIDTIGHTFSVPDTVLGVSILAMGTSVPDLCCSVIVFLQGFSGMAIANGFGSNIIDIMVCLGLPWCIKAAFFTEFGLIHTENRSFTYTSIYVIAAIILLYIILVANRFKLDRKVALASFTFYAGFLTVAICLEMNVFGLNTISRVIGLCNS